MEVDANVIPNRNLHGSSFLSQHTAKCSVVRDLFVRRNLKAFDGNPSDTGPNNRSQVGPISSDFHDPAWIRLLVAGRTVDNGRARSNFTDWSTTDGFLRSVPLKIWSPTGVFPGPETLQGRNDHTGLFPVVVRTSA